MTRGAGSALGSAVLAFAVHTACNRAEEARPGTVVLSLRPSILLVTVDTTRADSIGPDARGVETPAFNALAARGRRFRQAYATVPETLPSHSSILTGLYPAGHGVHENARVLAAHHPVLAERLQKAGYRTGAFVSSFVLARRFGLARGFSVYDDELPAGRPERTSKDTTDRAIAFLEDAAGPVFLWVHYFDPHAPYSPDEPFRSRYRDRPYLGEIAALDQQLGRLVAAFDARAGAADAIVVVSDHGEGLGDHGESQHGTLVYQSTMHVPLILVGPGIAAGVTDTPVSTRHVFHTVLDWAGLEAAGSLRQAVAEPVLGEAMKPYLEYGWLPQTMAVEGRQKAILAGKIEVYDVVADPAETNNLGSGAAFPPSARKALEEYPVPSIDASRAPENLSEEARRSLASLGYIGATAAPAVRRDAPRPADMVHLLDAIERASALFVEERYADAIPLLEKILADDSHNLDAALRLAIAHSALDHEDRALAAFRRAAAISPSSPDVRMYLALHLARGKDWERAVPMLETIVASQPERLAAVEGLARLRQRQGRGVDALTLRQQVYSLRAPTPAELIDLGRLAMSVQQTEVAIDAFEKARGLQSGAFSNDLELGVLYLAARRLPQARDALDRIPPSHPEYPMALFKRAQVSVLLNESDRGERIDKARRFADRTTKQLIENERLFRRP